MKPANTPNLALSLTSERLKNKRRLAIVAIVLALAFVLATSGFQTYWSKERRLISAADEIVTALKAYRDASPGTAKEFPFELADLTRDPRMLAEWLALRHKGYIATLPVDPIALKQEWGVVRNKNNQVIGVHSLSNESPTLFATFFSLRGGEKYSEGRALGHWKFIAE